MRIFITGMGITTPAGSGVDSAKNRITSGDRFIKPVALFSTPDTALPVGEIADLPVNKDLPRTHSMALIAAQEALKGSGICPDAVILGVTTGGMPLTEDLLREKKLDPELFQYHGTGTVAEYIARETGCSGPVITVSTACSSGAAAITMALELLKSGQAKEVLAGGADALCRLTYYGFNSLQLIDPEGARPFDSERRGMSVGEGAAMLRLSASEEPPENAIAELLGGGLSCDAHHATAPHPEGDGAFRAMKSALFEAGITPDKIDYISLHGTGTVDNDRSEARAIANLFNDPVPPSSSIKGALGHSLAAAGAVEAVISALCISDNIIPPNTGLESPDPELPITPIKEPLEKKVSLVLSNSFGFGGNNASLLFGDHGGSGSSQQSSSGNLPLAVLGSSCISGAGNKERTIKKILSDSCCYGILPLAEVSENLDARFIRRLKRLPRLVLSLAESARVDSNTDKYPSSIFFGTGWGPLSETHDFLKRLFDSHEKFTSPTDFVGSVHNAPPGQTAIKFKAKGPNITTTGGDFSFEQALFSASLLAGHSSGDVISKEDENNSENKNDNSIIIIGADEHHESLSAIFDPSCINENGPSDGGGALCVRAVKPGENIPGPKILPSFFKNTFHSTGDSIINELLAKLSETGSITDKFGAIFAGIPASRKEPGEKLLNRFIEAAGFQGPVIRYRKFTGEFASASAVGLVTALEFVRDGEIPAVLTEKEPVSLQGKGVLMLSLGDFVAAVEVF
ncbi:MAG: 3-oxoacyl-ACP synthase [bacterium]|nr:3-oxoacyl-ACP synthase [bacterium]